jgi:hypothetical protein
MCVKTNRFYIPWLTNASVLLHTTVHEIPIFLSSGDWLPIFSLLSSFWKNKNRHMWSPCVCLSVYPPINFWMPETIFTKPAICHGTCGHFNSILHSRKFLQSAYVSQHIYHLFVAKQRLGNSVTAEKNTQATIELLEASSSMRSMSCQRNVGD